MFNNKLATTEDMAIGGERALVNLYSGGKKGDTLDHQKVHSSTTSVHSQTLYTSKQPGTSTLEFTTKYRHGEDMICHPLTGVGKCWFKPHSNKDVAPKALYLKS